MEKTKKTAFWEAVLIGAKLLLICAVVAGVVSFVYALTEETYQKKQAETERLALEEIFGVKGLQSTALTVTDEYRAKNGIEETVYRVSDADGNVIGYYVQVKGTGFGGDVNLTVGFNKSCEVLGVKILDPFSETPGLGAKVKESAFLDQYNGKTEGLTLGKNGSGDVDAIAGATISSTAVTDGVNRAIYVLPLVLSENGGAVR